SRITSTPAAEASRRVSRNRIYLRISRVRMRQDVVRYRAARYRESALRALWPACLGGRLLLFPDINSAVKRMKRSFRAATVDTAGESAIDAHAEPAIGRIVLLSDIAAELEIKVAVDLAMVG